MEQIEGWKMSHLRMQNPVYAAFKTARQDLACEIKGLEQKQKWGVEALDLFQLIKFADDTNQEVNSNYRIAAENYKKEFIDN